MASLKEKDMKQLHAAFYNLAGKMKIFSKKNYVGNLTIFRTNYNTYCDNMVIFFNYLLYNTDSSNMFFIT